MIAIAHRLSTIARMDRLIVLDRAASSKAAPMPNCCATTGSMLGCGDGSLADFDSAFLDDSVQPAK